MSQTNWSSLPGPHGPAQIPVAFLVCVLQGAVNPGCPMAPPVAHPAEPQGRASAVVLKRTSSHFWLHCRHSFNKHALRVAYASGRCPASQCAAG